MPENNKVSTLAKDRNTFRRTRCATCGVMGTVGLFNTKALCYDCALEYKGVR